MSGISGAPDLWPEYSAEWTALPSMNHLWPVFTVDSSFLSFIPTFSLSAVGSNKYPSNMHVYWVALMSWLQPQVWLVKWMKAPMTPRPQPSVSSGSAESPHRHSWSYRRVTWGHLHSLSFLKMDFIHLYSERGEGTESGRDTPMCERNIHQLPLAHAQLRTWPATQACALTGNGTGDLLVHRPGLNSLNHTSQGCTIFLNNLFKIVLLLVLF